MSTPPSRRRLGNGVRGRGPRTGTDSVTLSRVVFYLMLRGGELTAGPNHWGKIIYFTSSSLGQIKDLDPIEWRWTTRESEEDPWVDGTTSPSVYFSDPLYKTAVRVDSRIDCRSSLMIRILIFRKRTEVEGGNSTVSTFTHLVSTRQGTVRDGFSIWAFVLFPTKCVNSRPQKKYVVTHWSCFSICVLSMLRTHTKIE